MRDSLVGKSLEKQRLFDFLETYLLSQTDDPKLAPIRQAYGTALISESHESFLNLIEKIYHSNLRIPGFTIVNAPSVHGHALFVEFDNPNMNCAYENNEELRSRMEFYQIKNEKQLATLRSDHEQQIYNLKHNHASQIETLRSNIYTMLSERDAKESLAIEGMESAEELENIKDTFSFIMISPLSLEALLAYIVYGVQLMTFTLVIVSIYMSSHDVDTYPVPIALTKGVDVTVHISQGISIFVIILVQQAIWESSADLSNGYNKHLKDQGVKYKWWLVSNLMRLSEGLVATAVTFVLVLTSENVVDLFKDFTAMTFVSSFDNIVYELANMKVIGRYMKQVAEKCENITYRTVLRRKIRGGSNMREYIMYLFYRYIMRPSNLVACLLITMYTLWVAWILIPHRRGTYVCQKLYIQFDDNVNPELSYFSGTYKIEKNEFRLRDNRNSQFFHSYVEAKTSNLDGNVNENREPMVLHYCHSRSKWVFLYKPPDLKQFNCDNDDFIMVESPVAADQQKFDLFEISFDEWEVKHEDGRMMPLVDLRVSCEDDGVQYLLKNATNMGNFIINDSTVCNNITSDQRLKRLESSHLWSADYKMMLKNRNPVLVYSHPVYYSKSNTINEIELILFVGKRWVITTDNHLNDYEEPHNFANLVQYLENDFHGKWSDYVSFFISEPVLALTPEDKPQPDKLLWYQSTPRVKNKTQVPDMNLQTPSAFLCKECNNMTNPCFNQGKCERNTCVCDNGSFGHLCEVIPMADGFCDGFFNKNQYRYDGGDCCIDTCVGKDNNICGKDKSSKFYVGYDLCKYNNEDECGDLCWQRNKEPNVFRSLYVSRVSISHDGHIMAVVEIVSQTVLVYENYGSEWKLRGSAVSAVINPNNDLIQVSGRNSILNSPLKTSPITVAVKSGRELSTYDWKDIFWNRTIILEEDITKIELRNEGKILGVLCQNKTFLLFDRADYSSQWNKIYSLDDTKIISMSEDGTKFASGNKSNCVELYEYRRSQPQVQPVSSKCGIVSDNEIQELKNIKISADGRIIDVLVQYEGTVGDLYRYNVSNNKFVSGSKVILRGLHVDSQIEMLRDPYTIATLSPSDHEVSFHEYDEKSHHWKRITNIFFPNSKFMSVSADSSTMALIASNGDLSHRENFLKVFHKPQKCPFDHSNIRLSFILDDSANQLKWEYVNVTKSGNIEVMKQGGPYLEDDAMVVDEMCVSNSKINSTTSSGDCIGIRIFDLGLNGLTSPGEVAISINGTVIWNVSRTGGYDQVFPVFGPKSCPEVFDNLNGPWGKYRETLHTECLQETCTWKNLMFPNETVYQRSSISADGTVIAMADYSNNEAEVNVLRYRVGGKEYSHHGQFVFVDNSIDEKAELRLSLSLSADGSVIAIGNSTDHPSDDAIDDLPGQVRVYYYDETKSDWLQRGSTINGYTNNENETILKKFGHSVSLSSDGTVLAIAHKKYDNSITFVNVYKYSINDEWNQLGSINDALNGNTEIEPNVKLSSTGMVIAISNKFHEVEGNDVRIGRVRVYSYNQYENNWMSRGDPIVGEKQRGMLGASISLSADGSILAVGSRCGLGVKIYEYCVNNDQFTMLGQEIPSIDPFLETKVDGTCKVEVTLSSNGLIVAVSEIRKIRIFQYDRKFEIWSESLTKINTIDNELVVDNEENDEESPLVSASADALTLTVLPKNKPAQILQLRKDVSTNSTCTNGLELFNFTLNTDEFSQDINWYLMDQNGNNIFRERLPESIDVKRYEECLSPDMYYRFYVEDIYGDGLCCDWGRGNFVVEWNNTISLNVSDNTFKTKKYACLPLPANTSIFSFEFFPGSHETFYSWDLFDGTNSIMGGSSDDLVFKLMKNKFGFDCVPSNTCFSFFTDFATAVVPYEAKYENVVVRDLKNITKIQNENGVLFDIGRTEFCKPCESDEVLIQWVMNVEEKLKSGLENNPNDFSWKLTNHSEVLKESNYSDTLEVGRRYYYEHCVKLTEYNCLQFEVKDRFNDDGLSDEHYTIFLNNTFYQHVEETKKSEIKLYDCQCKQGKKILEMVFRTKKPKKFSWVLERLNGVIITGGKDYVNDNTEIIVNECVSVTENECLNLFIRDDEKDGGTEYTVSWDNQVLINSATATNAFDRVKIGDCSQATCPQENNTLFELVMRTDALDEALGYELSVGSDIILSEDTGNYDGIEHPYHRECLQVKENECASLLLRRELKKIQHYDDNGLGVHYAAYWNGAVVKDALTKKTIELLIMPNNCIVTSCGENESLLEIYAYTGELFHEFTTKGLWKLFDNGADTNDLVDEFQFEEFGDVDEYKYHSYRKCVAISPNDGCARLLFEAYYPNYLEPDTQYAVAWNGQIAAEGVVGTKEVEELLGESCPSK